MDKDFDLFQLHDPELDIQNMGWICFKGKNLLNIVNSLILDVLGENNIKNRKGLCRLITNKSNIWIEEQIVYNQREWYPIPILQTLLDLTNKKDIYKKDILDNVQYLKCNCSSSKEIKAVKKLDSNLCKMAGAHAGDGSLGQDLRIEITKDDKKTISELNEICDLKLNKIKNRLRATIQTKKIKNFISDASNLINKRSITLILRDQINLTDGYFKAMVAYKKWIFEVFGLEVDIKRYNKKNAWRIDYNNKIISRYFTKFFGFPTNSKTYIVREPEIIKNSDIEFRKSFLVGLMTFEGYVPMGGNGIHIISKSKGLIYDVYDIFRKCNFDVKLKKDGYGRWICENLHLDDKKIKESLSFFEKDTEKWQKLYERLNGFSQHCKTITEGREILMNNYPKKPMSKISTVELFDLLLSKKTIDYRKLLKILKVNESTLRSHLNVIERMSIIKKEKRKPLILDFNKNFGEWRLPKL